jgi:hypothetical protein
VHDGTADWRAPAQAAAAAPSFDAIVLVEALDRTLATHALAHVRDQLGLAQAPGDFACDVYDFAYAFPGHTPQVRARYRRAHWDADT